MAELGSRAGHPAARCRWTSIARAGGELLGEAIARLRARRGAPRTPGYDGEYGVIRLFEPGELRPGAGTADDACSTLPRRRPAAAPAPARPAHAGPRAGEAAPHGARRRRSRRPPSPHRPWEPVLAGMEEVGTGLLDRLDAMQRVAASAPGGPLLVVAGPGTGKTRTLTHRIAYLCAELGVLPGAVPGDHVHPAGGRGDAAAGSRCCSAPAAEEVTVATFHALGLRSCGRTPAAAGLAPDFAVADDAAARRPRRAAARRRRTADRGTARLLREQDLVDLDELVPLPVRAAARRPDAGRPVPGAVAVGVRRRVPGRRRRPSTSCCGCSCPPDGNLCAIGDPDQAIYSFRGADVGYFLRFAEDFTDARLVRLTRNYRSSAPIIAAAVQVDRADLAGAGPAAGPGPAGPGGAAARPARGGHRRRPRRSGWSAPSTGWSAACRTGRSTPAGSTPARPSTTAVASPTSPCSTAPTPRPRRSWRR